MKAPSVRTRLAVTFSALFLLAGAALLVVNYSLMSEALNGTTWTFESNGTVWNGESHQLDGERGGSVGTYDGTPSLDTGAVFNMVDSVVTDYRAAAIQKVLIFSVGGLLLVGLMAALLGWLMAGRALRPVHRITATARRLEAERLDRRINLDGPRDELKELADTFDGMLDRLADSFDSQRRFVANASHELRTPLAVQRTLVEVAMADPTASPELLRLGANLLHANERNERLIDGLLMLARSDRGLTSREPVRLDRIAGKVLDAAAGLADRAGVSLRRDLAPRAVAGDPVLLERMITNLVHNAIHYNVPDGEVVVETGDGPALMVTNTGTRVPAEQVAGLFEPFRRLDRDRTAHRIGAGLGLSIVRSVARAHGGTVEAVPNEHGGLRVSVYLPVSALPVVENTVDQQAVLERHGRDLRP